MLGVNKSDRFFVTDTKKWDVFTFWEKCMQMYYLVNGYRFITQRKIKKFMK